MVPVIHEIFTKGSGFIYRENGDLTYRRACCVRGYHVYHRVWFAAIGEVVSCKESQPTVKRDTLWRSKKMKQSSGIYPERCRVFVRCFSGEGGPSIAELAEAEDIIQKSHDRYARII